MPYLTIDGPVYERSNSRRRACAVFLAAILVGATIGFVDLILL